MRKMTTDSGDSEAEHEEKVAKFLNKYPKAHLLYLEYLVTEKKSKIEKFHTQLAATYLDLLEAGDPANEQELRSKLQSLIINSDLVRAPFMLSRLEKTDLHQVKQDRIFAKQKRLVACRSKTTKTRTFFELLYSWQL